MFQTGLWDKNSAQFGLNRKFCPTATVLTSTMGFSTVRTVYAGEKSIPTQTGTDSAKKGEQHERIALY